MATTTRPAKFTPEQSAAWRARKMAQWDRVRDAFAPPPAPVGEPPNVPDLAVSMIQTSDTFIVQASAAGFNDEFVLGQPAHTVTRDDRLLNVPARDPSDAAVNAVIDAWKVRRKVTNFDPLQGKGEPPTRQ